LQAITTFLLWLENTPLALAIAESDWAFPLIEAIHVIALALVVGTVSILDFRLLGLASMSRSYRELAREVLPCTWIAFCLSVITGGLMFVTQAVAYFGNAAFRIKLVLLLLAGVNMLIFETIIARGAANWDHGLPVPLSGRIAAGLSLALWISIVFFGRRIGFTMMPE
jgi:hypothetical protein